MADVGSDIDMANLFEELHNSVNELGVGKVITHLRDIRYTHNLNFTKQIKYIIAVSAREFEVSVKELYEGKGRGARVDCLRVISYILAEKEEYDLQTIARIIGDRSITTVSKRKSFIKNLDPKIEWHRDLINKMNNILNEIENSDHGRGL